MSDDVIAHLVIDVVIDHILRGGCITEEEVGILHLTNHHDERGKNGPMNSLETTLEKILGIKKRLLAGL